MPILGSFSSGAAICSRRTYLVASTATLLFGAGGLAAADSPLRVGALRFGSLNWLLETIAAEGLAEREGVAVERLDLASNQATTVALQAGRVDMIVSDWLWALRQRAEGEKLLFHPYSRALGALVVPADSPIGSPADLMGRSIGVAGSPLDKSWLLLRAHLRDGHGFDPASEAEPVYGAPPLLSEQLRIGRLDAVLTYWNFAARLEAEGYRVLLEMDQVMRALDIEPPPPLVGFVWPEALMAERAEEVVAFFRAVDRAQTRLAQSNAAWERLRPLMQLGSEAEFEVLRAHYRAGIPPRWDSAQLSACETLFELLADIGGPELVGAGTRFDPALFWAGAETR